MACSGRRLSVSAACAMPASIVPRRLTGDLLRFCGGALAILALTLFCRYGLGLHNVTFAGLSYLLVILLVASVSSFRVAASLSMLALLTLNYFFMPPVGRFTIEDPQNWVALVAFFTVGLVASRLSQQARHRADDAAARRDELSRLFDLSRDILLTTDGHEALNVLSTYVARRFGLDYVGVCLAEATGWERHESSPTVSVDAHTLDLALAEARGTLEFDAETRTYGGHRLVTSAEGQSVRLVPLRIGARVVGLLAAAGKPVDAGTLDAIAGLAAIAIERARLLDERQVSERARQAAELKSALLSSLGHDLKTPLTAITVAADNLRTFHGDDDQRREQLGLITTEVGRLNRLFQNIVDMVRIETDAVAVEPEWVHPGDIVEAAVQQVSSALSGHPLELDLDPATLVQVDPRLSSAALAHILENAGQYSPDGTPVTIVARVGHGELSIAVRDRGPGVAAETQVHLFDGFYQSGSTRRRTFGSGIGLAITRGLLAAQQGRVWVEHDPGGGACFTMAIPAAVRAVAAEDELEA
jgi:two-component system, OmpR family, sensor histidine kinase KdpD